MPDLTDVPLAGLQKLSYQGKYPSPNPHAPQVSRGCHQNAHPRASPLPHPTLMLLGTTVADSRWLCPSYPCPVVRAAGHGHPSPVGKPAEPRNAMQDCALIWDLGRVCRRDIFCRMYLF